MISERHIFANGQDLATSLALAVVTTLEISIAQNGKALLAVSGGTTPKPFFAALSKMKLDWAKVKITLVDERQVGEDSPRSNAKLVKESLLVNQAAAAVFVPLFQNPDAVNLPSFDVAILGMGSDGHTASFFPGGDNLKSALDSNCPSTILPMIAEGAGEPRLTFTLPKLLASKTLHLHIQGQDKMAVLDKALAGTDIYEMPIRAVLTASKPIDLYWCP